MCSTQALFSAEKHQFWAVLTLSLWAGGCIAVAIARIFVLPNFVREDQVAGERKTAP